ncbi:MAG: hypothetical protein H6Q05_1280 [Acidobacteria bacterium]|nr:hypothetical protein [Acidobacteriota bacterium]
MPSFLFFLTSIPPENLSGLMTLCISTPIASPMPIPCVVGLCGAYLDASTGRRHGGAFQGRTAIGNGFMLE